MSPREELDLILKLIRKYNLPLSPILEYAVNEKKEEYPEEDAKPVIPEHKDDITVIETSYKQEDIAEEESATIELTYELIEAARTPNGGFTKSQLAVLGISWPAPSNWIEEKVGTFITSKQLEDFNHIEYVVNKPLKNPSMSLKGTKTYKDIASDDRDQKRLEAVLAALEHFDVPATPRDVARTVSRSAWGGAVKEDSVDTMLKRLPEVEYIPLGKYILKKKNKTTQIDKCKNYQERVISGYSVNESVCQHNPISLEEDTNTQTIKNKVSIEQYRLVSPISESTDITLELIQKMVNWDKEHRVLDDWKLKVMQDVADGKKEFTDKMRYAFYLNLQTLKKKGFSN